jgi:hypothetical protein
MINLFVYDEETGYPLEGVQVSIPALRSVKFTGAIGEENLDTVEPGTYSGRLIREGYKDRTFTFTIKASEPVSLMLNLEACA